MGKRYFIIGAHRDNHVWLINWLRAKGEEVVDINDSRLITLYFSSEENHSRLVLDNNEVQKSDIVFFYGPPSINRYELSDVNQDFLYSEWRAALETVLAFSTAKVINKYWLLQNTATRHSGKYWTRRCSRMLTINPRVTLTWQDNKSIENTTPEGSVRLETIITRRQIISVPAPLIELSDMSTVRAFYEIQQVLIEKQIDFLLLHLDILKNGEITISHASPELPTFPVLPFQIALDDFC